AEDGIRDFHVTGVQTCALPISVSFRVMGKDPVQLREIGHRVREIMASHPNTLDSRLEWDERAPVMHLVMDSERLRPMGLTPRDVAQQLQVQLDGVPVTEVRQDIRTVEVRARGLRGVSPMPEVLEIKTQDGRKVALAQLGSLEIRYEEPVIKRYNREPFLAIHADVQGAQAPDVTAAIWRQLADLRASLPDGYRIEIGGSVEQSGDRESGV